MIRHSEEGRDELIHEALHSCLALLTMLEDLAIDVQAIGEAAKELIEHSTDDFGDLMFVTDTAEDAVVLAECLDLRL